MAQTFDTNFVRYEKSGGHNVTLTPLMASVKEELKFSLRLITVRLKHTKLSCFSAALFAQGCCVMAQFSADTNKKAKSHNFLSQNGSKEEEKLGGFFLSL